MRSCSVIRYLLMVLLAVTPVSCSNDIKEPRDEGAANMQQGPNVLQITVDDHSLAINGASVKIPGERSDFITLLGQPSRVERPGMVTVIWDQIGVYVTEHPKTGKTSAFSVAFNKKATLKYWPETPFKGALRVDGALITAQSTIAAINGATKTKKFRETFIQGSWQLQSDDLFISLVQVDPTDRSNKMLFAYFEVAK